MSPLSHAAKSKSGGRRGARGSAGTARYKPHPLLEGERSARRTTEQETGKTFAAWVALGRAQGPTSRRALEAWLRDRHGVRPMASQWIAHSILTSASDDDAANYAEPERLVDALYSGAKASLRPLHEAVVDLLLGLGSDVIVTACKTMVPAYRKHVFAQLTPGSAGVTLHLALGEVAAQGRLATAPGGVPGERLTHVVLLRTQKDVDAEVETWLRRAYELGASKLVRSTAFEVPDDFARALERSRSARSTWSAMTPAMQRDMVQWVTSAKQAQTRAKRQRTALAKLVEGKKRVY